MTGKELLRVGVVGTGVMGERHARVYSGIAETTLVAVYDSDGRGAHEVADRYGAIACGSLDQLLAMVDALSITSATFLHADIAIAAIQAGKHVLIETPLADCLAGARRILDCLIGRPDLTVMVGHIERFNPTVGVLRRRIEGQRITAIETRRMSPFDGRSTDSDVIHNLMIHDIDLVLDLLGDNVRSIDAAGFAVATSYIDRATAELTMVDGVQASLIASRVALSKVRVIEVQTDREQVFVDLLTKSVVVTPASPGAVQTCLEVPGDEPLHVELQHFVDCVLTRAEPLASIDAGYRALIYANSIKDLIRRSRHAGSFQALVAHAGG